MTVKAGWQIHGGSFYWPLPSLLFWTFSLKNLIPKENWSWTTTSQKFDFIDTVTEILELSYQVSITYNGVGEESEIYFQEHK